MYVVPFTLTLLSVTSPSPIPGARYRLPSIIRFSRVTSPVDTIAFFSFRVISLKVPGTFYTCPVNLERTVIASALVM